MYLKIILLINCLKDLKNLKSHSAFIVDEYGTLQGMVTLNDILDAIGR